mmetsp:Transcript_39807/g.112494  ORF Transcript_39807/g.112494 Transcript_39807/m.112494 type:complete len:234 (+) Transcript_39807:1207-1908(+)
MTCTVPCSQIRDLSFRSTSVHIVISDSSFGSVRICLMFCASSRAFLPRRIVPLMGHVSTRRPWRFFSTRTNISGEAPTRNSSLPRLMRKPYGDGLRFWRRWKSSLGGSRQGSRKVWDSTASKRSPRANFSLALSTSLANSPGWNSRQATSAGISDRGWKGTSAPPRARPFVEHIPLGSLKTKSYLTRQACWLWWLMTRRLSGMYITRSRCSGSRCWCIFTFSNWNARSYPKAP